jgi:large subunit ribosomal protein L17
MRHRVAHRKLGRKTEHRTALLRNLCTSLIVHERLITTLPKAKELRPFAERAITLGKRGLNADSADALHARRLAASYFFSGNTNRVPDGGYKRPRAPRTAGVFALDKLFGDVAGRFSDRPGGYTRILKLGARRGDGAEMALIELVGSESKATHVEDKKEEKKKSRRFFGRGRKEESKGGESKKIGDEKLTKKSTTRATAAKGQSKSEGKKEENAESGPKSKRKKRESEE